MGRWRKESVTEGEATSNKQQSSESESEAQKPRVSRKGLRRVTKDGLSAQQTQRSEEDGR